MTPPLPRDTAHRLTNDAGLELTVLPSGALWQSCQVPMADGTRREVLLGRRDPHEPLARACYLGATIGRYANRIGHARITRDGDTRAVAANPGSRHQLHGGPEGFDVRPWTVEHLARDELRLGLTSPDGDQGFPGELTVSVTYRLLDGLGIEMVAEARTTAPTPVCLTNHAYFNLDVSHGSTAHHQLQVDAGQYLPVDAELIPLGHLALVDHTGFDFRDPKALDTDWLRDEQQQLGGGYDHAFLIEPGAASMQRPICHLTSSSGDLGMSMYSTLPSLQFYGGQYLAGVPSRDGTPHVARAGIALEPQFLPDSPNHPEWPQPSCWLLPDQRYHHVIRWVFSHPG